jgi:hypothetical protein
MHACAQVSPSFERDESVDSCSPDDDEDDELPELVPAEEVEQPAMMESHIMVEKQEQDDKPQHPNPPGGASLSSPPVRVSPPLPASPSQSLSSVPLAGDDKDNDNGKKEASEEELSKERQAQIELVYFGIRVLGSIFAGVLLFLVLSSVARCAFSSPAPSLVVYDEQLSALSPFTFPSVDSIHRHAALVAEEREHEFVLAQQQHQQELHRLRHEQRLQSLQGELQREQQRAGKKNNNLQLRHDGACDADRPIMGYLWDKGCEAREQVDHFARMWLGVADQLGEATVRGLKATAGWLDGDSRKGQGRAARQ